MKINREGYNIIAVTLLGCTAVGAACFIWAPGWVAWPVAALMLIHIAFTAWFFREPKRTALRGENTVFAPADGKVVVIEPVKVDEYFGGQECIQVSVFMSLTNVHINWFPTGGEVVYHKYHPGRFMIAWQPKSSELNERTTTVVDTGRHRILFRQIAGFVARRIVSYAAVGSRVEQNTKCGFIKFGSRVDIMLPPDSEILVAIGDRVTGAQTPVARLK